MNNNGFMSWAGPRNVQPGRFTDQQGMRGPGHFQSPQRLGHGGDGPAGAMAPMRPGVPAAINQTRGSPLAPGNLLGSGLHGNNNTGARFLHPQQLLQQQALITERLQQHQQLQQLQLQQQLRQQLQQNQLQQQGGGIAQGTAGRGTGLNNARFPGAANSNRGSVTNDARFPANNIIGGLNPGGFSGPAGGGAAPHAGLRSEPTEQWSRPGCQGPAFRQEGPAGPRQWDSRQPGWMMQQNRDSAGPGPPGRYGSGGSGGGMGPVDAVFMSRSASEDRGVRSRMSPDRRTDYSREGSYMSDSLSSHNFSGEGSYTGGSVSSRTDTDSSSRGTPLSWDSHRHGNARSADSGLDTGSTQPSDNRYGTSRRDRNRYSSPGRDRGKYSSPGKDRSRCSSPGRDRRRCDSPGRDRGRGSSPGRDRDRYRNRGSRDGIRYSRSGGDSGRRDRDGRDNVSRERARDVEVKKDKLPSQRTSRPSSSASGGTSDGDGRGSVEESSGRAGNQDDDTNSLQNSISDDRERRGSKRPRGNSPEPDIDDMLIDRERRLVKRLRPDSRELKAKAEEEAATEMAAEDSTPSWIRCSPADLYFTRNASGSLDGTQKMTELEDLFEKEIVSRASKIRASMPDVDVPARVSSPCHHHHHHHHGSGSGESSSSSSSESESDSDSDDEMCSKWMAEMERKRKHPLCLHPELWYNDPGEMNNGPLCRCSIKARRSGIRHDIYPGEKYVENCDTGSNNLQRLHHYRITMSPSTNFLSNSPTVIDFDNHEFIFEGFSLFTHEKLENVPLCKVIRFHIEYTIHFFEEAVPENFTIRSLDLFNQFLFSEVLELVDMDWKGFGDGCNRFHLMPRFARSLPENGKEILSMNEVLKFLLRSSRPLVAESDLPLIQKLDKEAWQSWVDVVCGMIVTHPGKKPSSLRVDQLDRTKLVEGNTDHLPILVHFGIRPAQLSYAGDPAYQKAWKQYIKLKHLLNSKPKVSADDKVRLKSKEAQLQEIQAKSTMKREVTVELSTEGFLRTGLKSDICQHALLLPVLLSHIRFHNCLAVLENHLLYTFKDRTLLQLALTHTSFRTNYGTNSAHARNSLTNCGLRQVEYGDRRVYYQNTRKRGINILVDIMARLGRKEETMSEIPHNERLEFLGDAVIEFLSSVHLFFMFPWLEEGGLSTYRTAIVQNQHLAVLAKNLRLQDFMLYVHGPDLCHESDLRHAMANCFEALMGALFLDGGLQVVEKIFGRTLFGDDNTCLRTWQELPLHPLQEDEPGGDRHWIESSPTLQKLKRFEDSIGVMFCHVRLLAKAFTHRNVGYNMLTMGHNQRLEFLGDTVLQLIASEYLYKHFPEHHEGHLSLLRSSLVNSRTQSIVCDDLGMMDFVIYSNVGSDKLDMKTKQKADLLESFLGALYVDQGMEFCTMFCDVCFFPRLKDFIQNQDWNDPKSQLQQCCLTLRKMGGGEPDIPVYKVIESLGPSNTRKYVVAVYFRGERLATGTGHSIQQGEMSAATNALKMRSELFPILQHQRRFLEREREEEERKARPRQYRGQSASEGRRSGGSSKQSGSGRNRGSRYTGGSTSRSSSASSRYSRTASASASRCRDSRSDQDGGQ